MKTNRKFVATLILAILIVCCCFAFSACNKNDGKDGDFVLPSGSRPNYDSLFSAAALNILDAATKEDADEDVKKSAVMVLYNAANRSRIKTSTSLMLQSSDLGISLGEVLLHGFNLKAEDKWFYQLAGAANTDNPAMNGLANMFASFLKIAYLDEEGYHFVKISGDAPQSDCTYTEFPYASYILTQPTEKFDRDTFLDKLNCLDDMLEIVNLAFCEEIIADGAEITYDVDKKLYTVNFAVDMDSSFLLVEKWYEKAQKDMNDGGQHIDRYNYYEATLEVWDNGYAKSFKSSSSRSAGMASGDPVDEFSYIWNENEIMDILNSDFRLNTLEENANHLDSPRDYVEYYSKLNVEKAKLSTVKIVLIVIGSVIGAVLIGVIIAVIVVETLLKQGKLPKLAEKRAKKKQLRLKKKEAAKRKKQGAKNNDELIDDNADAEIADSEDVALSDSADENHEVGDNNADNEE